MDWSEGLAQTVYAGDSDQAIFRFVGTVPEAFINLKHDWSHHLEQSYRVPTAVRDYAAKIIGLAKNREETEYKSVSKDMEEYKGEGRVVITISPDLTLEGTHMILCRCKYQISRWLEILVKNNYIWHNPYRPEDRVWNPTLTQSWIAARTYYDIMRGRDVKAADFKKLVSRLKPGFAKRGMKKEIKAWSGKERVDLFNLASLGFTDDFIDHTRLVGDVIKMTHRVGSLLSKAANVEAVEAILCKPPKVVIGTIHCSPPDEPILTTDGWTPLGQLDNKKHRLASYSRTSNRLQWGGKNAKHGQKRKDMGYAFDAGRRNYTGPLVTLKYKRNKSRITPDHKVLVKLASSFFGKWVVYLMRRNDWYRIGICVSGHRPYKSGGITARLATEKADCAWILKVCETREEAIYEENKTQMFFGIPGLTFEASSGQRVLGSKQMQEIHELSKMEIHRRIKVLFDYFGIYEDHPLWTRQQKKIQKRNMRSAFVTIAANINEHMELLITNEDFVFEKTIKVKW